MQLFEGRVARKDLGIDLGGVAVGIGTGVGIGLGRSGSGAGAGSGFGSRSGSGSSSESSASSYSSSRNDSCVIEDKLGCNLITSGAISSPIVDDFEFKPSI
ncbi:hypothetical protein ACLB2K_016212 [Fragaria x ananassa]